jgi:hypothetical protein
MSIFPSQHERSITIAIFAFVIGCVIGLATKLSQGELQVLATAGATLLAAFLGAKYAFNLQNRRIDEENIESNVEAGNASIFAIINNYQKFVNFRDQFINVYRDNRNRHIIILPAVGMSRYMQIEFESLRFMFKSKHVNLLSQLSLYQAEVESSLEVIQMRSELHSTSVQEKIEQAGLGNDDAIDLNEAERILGLRTYTTMLLLTNQMIDAIDRVIADSERLVPLLRKAMLDIYPGHAVVGMEKIN